MKQLRLSLNFQERGLSEYGKYPLNYQLGRVATAIILRMQNFACLCLALTLSMC